ncbi:MAG: protein kinase [Candidatus Eisenbacteria bacterium]
MTEPTDRDRAEDIAGELADGAALDWEDLRSSLPNLGSTLQRLEELERIARFHERVGSDEPIPKGEPWGPLVLLGQIAEGAFGRVDRAFDPTLHREVVLKRSKVRTPGASDRLLAEARRLARVRHPNVVAVYGAAEVDDETGIWMEPLHGRTLEAYLHDHGRLTPASVLAIGRDVASAMAAIHGAGLVHGDIKASNVVEDDAGRFVLIDFGSGRNLDRLDLPFPSGTPLVLAPEVVQGGDTSPASDLYALGVLLFRLLTGRHPVEAGDMRALLEAHRSGRQAKLDDYRNDVPPALVGWIDSLLEPSPEKRPGDARTVAASLASLIAAFPGPEETAPLRSPPTRSATKSGPPWDALPQTTDRFVGRSALLHEVTTRLESGSPVTLLAPGGWGKSRLALEVARTLRLRRRDGVVWFDLRGTQGGAFWEAALAALGPETRCPDPREFVIERLRGRKVLVVVDNAESCPEECVRLIDDLSAPTLEASIWLLFTSREALSHPAESTVAVPPLSSGMDSADEAFELLVDRIRARAPGRDLKASTVALQKICRLTGGVPLGLELAAYQSDLMTPDEIARGLERKVSADSPRDPEWKRLEPCLQWSYERLSPDTQHLLRLVSVWARVFRVEDAAFVLETEETWEVAAAVRELSERGLARAEAVGPDGAEVHEFRLPEPVRRFGRARLEDQSEEPRALELHANRFIELCSKLPEWPMYAGRPLPAWVGRAHDDLVGAWRHCLTQDRWEDAADFCIRLAPHWTVGSRAQEAAAILTETIEAAPEEARAKTEDGRHKLIRLYFLLGGAKQSLRRHAESAEANEAAMSLAVETGDRAFEAFGLSRVAGSEILLGRPEAAGKRLERAWGLAEEVGAPWLLGNVQANLALWHQRTGNLAEARRWCERALDSRKRSGDRSGEVVAIAGLAAIAWEEEEFDRARTYLTEALEVQDSVPDTSRNALILFNLGSIEATVGNEEAALARWRETLELLETAPEQVLRARAESAIARIDPTVSSFEARQASARELAFDLDRVQGTVPSSLQGYATQLVRESRTADAVRLYGAAHALQKQSGLVMPKSRRPSYDEEVRRLEEIEPSFEELWREGESDPEAMIRWTLDDASRR